MTQLGQSSASDLASPLGLEFVPLSFTSVQQAIHLESESFPAEHREKLAAVGTLAMGLAHEIRNPLNGALLQATLLARLLQKQHADPRMADAVDAITHEISRLGTLVTEFLAFARFTPLSPRLLVVGPLIERVAELLAPPAMSHPMTVALDLPPVPLHLKADGEKLEQVLLNLGRNAIEAIAGASSGGRVILRAYRRLHTTVVEVEDDGPGVASDCPIFAAFVSTKPRSTGLGLTISSEIVARHGGTLEVESCPGRTIFRVRLPTDGA